MNKYRFDGKFQYDMANDFLALAEANMYHDDHAVSVEKLVNGFWCPHTTPISHPNIKNDGWVLPNNEILPSCED